MLFKRKQLEIILLKKLKSFKIKKRMSQSRKSFLAADLKKKWLNRATKAKTIQWANWRNLRIKAKPRRSFSPTTLLWRWRSRSSSWLKYWRLWHRRAIRWVRLIIHISSKSLFSNSFKAILNLFCRWRGSIRIIRIIPTRKLS